MTQPETKIETSRGPDLLPAKYSRKDLGKTHSEKLTYSSKRHLLFTGSITRTPMVSPAGSCPK